MKKAVTYGSYLVPGLGTYNLYKASRFAFGTASLIGDLILAAAVYGSLTTDSFTDGFLIDSYLNTEPDDPPKYFVTYAEAFPTAYY